MRRHGPAFLGLTVAACLLRLLGAASALAAGELARNGLFAEGADSEPADWKSEAWTSGTSVTRFGWSVNDLGIGSVTIENLKPNDARWVQSVPVSPSTWYHVSGWVRAENVGGERIGAYLSVMDTFYNSRDLRGTQDWQPVAFWVKTGPLETALKIACRLGGYGAENTGKAEFTGVSVEAAGTPPKGAPYVYGGSPDEPAGTAIPWARAAALLVVIGIGGLLWRYFLAPSRP